MLIDYIPTYWMEYPHRLLLFHPPWMESSSAQQMQIMRQQQIPRNKRSGDVPSIKIPLRRTVYLCTLYFIEGAGMPSCNRGRPTIFFVVLLPLFLRNLQLLCGCHSFPGWSIFFFCLTKCKAVPLVGDNSL